MIFVRRLRLRNMERETTGAELLLSEPEIVAWLGLHDKHDNVSAQPRRAESPHGGRSLGDWQVCRAGDVRQAVPTARALRLGMVL